MPTEEQTYRAYVKDKLESIESKVTYTNGKVRKITIALVLIAGIVIGQSVGGTHELISLIMSAAS